MDRAERSGSVGLVFTLLASSLLLSTAALYNGFPLVWPDSAQYILSVDLGFRTPFYGYLIHALHRDWSFWPVVFVQCLLIAHVLWLVTRVVFGRPSDFEFILVIAGLSILSSLPWYTALLMPDLFAPVLGFSIFLLAFHSDDLTPAERLYLKFLCFLSVLMHLSHLPLAIGCIGVVLVMGKLSRNGGRPTPSGRVFLRLAIPVALAVVVLVANTRVVHGAWGVSAQGQLFLLARLLTDGPGARVLDEECPREGWRLCDARHDIPKDSDALLWDPEGPVQRLGGFEPVAGEAAEIVRATLKRFPGQILVQSGLNAVKQLARFDTGHGLIPYAAEEHPTAAIRSCCSQLVPAYEGARQNLDTLYMDAIAGIHRRIVLFAFALGIAFTGLGVFFGYPAPVQLFLFSCLLLVVNASVTGALSGPNHRYQSRVVWVLVFFALTALLAALRHLHPGERGLTAEIPAHPDP